MAAYFCNHMLDSSIAPKIIYWTAYGCIKFCNLVAYNCTRVSLMTVKSCLETAVTVLASTALSRGFFIVDKLFIIFVGRTVISALIVWLIMAHAHVDLKVFQRKLKKFVTLAV